MVNVKIIDQLFTISPEISVADMSLILRKPIYRIYDQLQQKQGYAATEDG